MPFPPNYAHRSSSDQTITVPLIDDQTGQTIEATIRISSKGIEITADGYGEKTAEVGAGALAFFEYYGGEVQLHVFSDINKEDPTHNISFEDAKETNRRAE